MIRCCCCNIFEHRDEDLKARLKDAEVKKSLQTAISQ